MIHERAQTNLTPSSLVGPVPSLVSRITWWVTVVLVEPPREALNACAQGRLRVVANLDTRLGDVSKRGQNVACRWQWNLVYFRRALEMALELRDERGHANWISVSEVV